MISSRPDIMSGIDLVRRQKGRGGEGRNEKQWMPSRRWSTLHRRVGQDSIGRALPEQKEVVCLVQPLLHNSIDSYTPSTITDGLYPVVLNANKKVSLLSSPVMIRLNAGIYRKK